jgi:hypothetical protein
LIFVYMFIFGCIFHGWEKTWGFCVSDPGLLHITWCLPIASIYLKTTWYYSLWMSNTPLCIYTTISWSIHKLKHAWVVSKACLLWIVLLWTSVYRCLCCILFYVPLGRCPGEVSLENGHTTKSNLHVQWNPIKIPIKFCIEIKINHEMHMETQKTSNSQRNSKQKVQCWRHHNTWFQTIIQSHKWKNSMMLGRLMNQNRGSRHKPYI